MSNNRMASSPKRIYQAARYTILIMVALTVMNVILSFLDSDSYYVSSVFASFFTAVAFENAIGIVLGALILVPYVLAFIFSKKKWAWMIVALVLAAIDLLFLIAIGLLTETLLYSILDLVAHAAIIVVLILGVVRGKAATADPETVMTTDAATDADPQRSAQGGQADSFIDVLCTVSVSQDGQRHSFEAEGLARFYANELALGTNSVAQTLLIGSAFASTKEQIRFAYTDIVRAYYAKKNERTVRIDLQDGRYAYLIFTKANAEQAAELLYAHGVTIEPFAE